MCSSPCLFVRWRLTALAQRHIGNDIAVVVFLEPGARFSPAVFTNQFNRNSKCTR
jgi:hypothetical protein